jgi:hypothetical protein
VKSVVVEYDRAGGAASAGKLRFAASCLAVVLEVEEEEQLVLDERTAQASAVDVAARLGIFGPRLFQEVVGRRQLRVLEIFEDAAGQLMGWS